VNGARAAAQAKVEIADAMERGGPSMGTDERDDEVGTPEDLAEALRANSEAEAIWGQLPEAHRRGHVIAIRRIEDADARAERIEHTIEHLLEKHAS
jgi:uncharacterized protein YdeI (YjbR/CyaY-like superfamily)